MSEHIHRILVPVDGSEQSTRAALLARDLAVALGVPLTLLFVYEPVYGSLAGAAQLTKEEVQAAGRLAAADAFGAVETAFGDRVPEAQRQVSWGQPAEEVVAIARQHPQAMVVMGRRGLGAVAGALLGSVSQAVLRHAPGPVTLVS
ncbi:MAG: universal stress protein [Pseudomonadales bacterium]|jgi:nucleotide-binding universal stress UspA family protein|nr:universal stress protein [Pseudomonadales bacterium]